MPPFRVALLALLCARSVAAFQPPPPPLRRFRAPAAARSSLQDAWETFVDVHAGTWTSVWSTLDGEGATLNDHAVLSRYAVSADGASVAVSETHATGGVSADCERCFDADTAATFALGTLTAANLPRSWQLAGRGAVVGPLALRSGKVTAELVLRDDDALRVRVALTYAPEAASSASPAKLALARVLVMREAGGDDAAAAFVAEARSGPLWRDVPWRMQEGDWSGVSDVWNADGAGSGAAVGLSSGLVDDAPALELRLDGGLLLEAPKALDLGGLPSTARLTWCTGGKGAAVLHRLAADLGTAISDDGRAPRPALVGLEVERLTRDSDAEDHPWSAEGEDDRPPV